MLIKPFTSKVNASGIAELDVTHSLAGMVWVVYQVGFALNLNAGSPQVAAQVNGMPLGATIAMQPSAFTGIPGFASYGMLSFMVGPPYTFLNSGDKLSCAVLGATSGDTFTAGAFIDELSAQQAENYTQAGTYIAGA